MLLDIRKSILQNISLDEPDTPVHLASFSGEYEKLNQLIKEDKHRNQLDKKNRLGCTPLRLAATAGHSECVKILLSQEAAVDVIDVKAQTPLYVAVKNKHLSCLKMLLEAGADPDGNIGCFCSPLCTAAFEGFYTGLKELITHGASLNLTGQLFGSITLTPLRISLTYSHMDCFKELLLSGADPNYHLKIDADGRYISTYSTQREPNSKNRMRGLYHTAIHRNVDVQFVVLLYEYGTELYERDMNGHLPCDLVSNNECSAYVKTLYESPRRLIQTCRIALRRYISEKRLKFINKLPLPGPLIKYVSHDSF